MAKILWHMPPQIATFNRGGCSLCFWAVFSGRWKGHCQCLACAVLPARKPLRRPWWHLPHKGCRNGRSPFAGRRTTMGWVGTGTHFRRAKGNNGVRGPFGVAETPANSRKMTGASKSAVRRKRHEQKEM
jgi:hypothetical protein